jgi:hypothetical protein
MTIETTTTSGNRNSPPEKRLARNTHGKIAPIRQNIGNRNTDTARPYNLKLVSEPGASNIIGTNITANADTSPTTSQPHVIMIQKKFFTQSTSAPDRLRK